jgi:hypothetical protein
MHTPPSQEALSLFSYIRLYSRYWVDERKGRGLGSGLDLRFGNFIRTRIEVCCNLMLQKPKQIAVVMATFVISYLFAPLSGDHAPAQSPGHPNILIILTDD